MQVLRRAAGAQQPPGLTAHPRTSRRTEVHRLGLAERPVAGRDDVLVEGDVEDLGAEDLEGGADPVHGPEGGAPVVGGTGRREAGLGEDAVELLRWFVEPDAGQSGNDLAGSLDVGVGGDVRAVPRVAGRVVGPRPGLRGSLQVAGQVIELGVTDVADRCAGQTDP